MKVFGELRYTPAKAEKGYTDRILRIDLSKQTISIEAVPKEMRQRLVGGRGYCLQLVFDGTKRRDTVRQPGERPCPGRWALLRRDRLRGHGKFIAGTISP